MNSLRFRAFFKGKMYKVACINFFTEILWLDFGEDDRPVCAIKDAILMQSTGLKDKNKKEIFSGDILKVFLDEKRGYAITIAWYMAPTWMLGDYSTGKLKGSFEMDDWGRGTIVDEFEIIGNKWEHPYLLEQGVKNE